MRKILLLLTLSAAGLFFQGISSVDKKTLAQDDNQVLETTVDESPVPTLPPTNEPVEDKVITTLSGEVVKIEGDKMTLRTDDDEIKEVIIASDAQIKVNTRPGKLEDIDVDDKVVLTIDDEEVIIVEATDNNVSDLKTILPIIAIGILALAFIGYLISKKANQGEIKTTPTKLS